MIIMKLHINSNNNKQQEKILFNKPILLLSFMFLIYNATITIATNNVQQQQQRRRRRTSAIHHYTNNDNNKLSLYNFINNIDKNDYLTNHNDVFSSSRSSFTTAIPRGGASSIVTEKDDNDNSSIIIVKIRNIIRSILKSNKKGTIMHSVVTKVCNIVESTFGIRLLPKPTEEVKRKKKKKKKKTSLVIDEDSTTTKTTENVSTTKKKKKDTSTASTTATKAKTNTNNDDDVNESEGKVKKSSSKKKKKKSKISTKPNKAALEHIKKDIKSTNPNYRIQRELKAFIQDPPKHLSVKVSGKNIRIWIVQMEGIGIYTGEIYNLRIEFPKNYPTKPPSVYFLPPNIPIHEHVYTNGDICLSLLGKDWRPTMTGQSIAHSILSILGSATSKSLPMDNSKHSLNKPGQYQENWVYHDDLC